MVKVDCAPLDGPGGIEPVAVWFGARRVDVRAVTDRWWGRDKRWWKVETDEGAYIVSLDEAHGSWDLAAVVGQMPPPLG